MQINIYLEIYRVRKDERITAVGFTKLDLWLLVY